MSTLPTESIARMPVAIGKASIRTSPLTSLRTYVLPHRLSSTSRPADFGSTSSESHSVPTPAQALSKRRPRLPGSHPAKYDALPHQLRLQVRRGSLLSWRERLWRPEEGSLPSPGRGGPRRGVQTAQVRSTFASALLLTDNRATGARTRAAHSSDASTPSSCTRTVATPSTPPELAPRVNAPRSNGTRRC